MEHECNFLTGGGVVPIYPLAPLFVQLPRWEWLISLESIFGYNTKLHQMEKEAKLKIFIYLCDFI